MCTSGEHSIQILHSKYSTPIQMKSKDKVVLARPTDISSLLILHLLLTHQSTNCSFPHLLISVHENSTFPSSSEIHSKYDCHCVVEVFVKFIFRSETQTYIANCALHYLKSYQNKTTRLATPGSQDAVSGS